MSNRKFGGYDEEGPNYFNLSDIREFAAITKVTGKDVQGAIEDQAIITRQNCASRICGAFATLQSCNAYVSMEVPQGGFIEGRRLFASLEAGCSSSDCQGKGELLESHDQRVLGLGDACIGILGDANEKAVEIRQKAKVEAGEVLAPAEAEAESILKPAQEAAAGILEPAQHLAREITLMAEGASSAIRIQTMQEGLEAFSTPMVPIANT